MTVMERIYDNAWFVANADPEARQGLAESLAQAIRTWEQAQSAAREAQAVSPFAVALALSDGNAAQAHLDRVRTQVEAAGRCTHVISGHAFSISRTYRGGGGRQLEVASCTLPRSASMSLSEPGATWTALLVDPDDRHDPARVILGPDRAGASDLLDPCDVEDLGDLLDVVDPQALLRVCQWIVSGQL